MQTREFLYESHKKEKKHYLSEMLNRFGIKMDFVFKIVIKKMSHLYLCDFKKKLLLLSC